MRYTKIYQTLGAGALMILALTACSSLTNPVNENFTSPGEEVNSEIVEPMVTMLPSPIVETHETIAAEKEKNSASTQERCNAVSSVNDEAIYWLNHFDLEESAPNPMALKNEEIIAMKQMSVNSSYGTVFKSLMLAELDSGASVWFGFDGNLNDEESHSRIGYDIAGDQPLFGATAETYEHFSWGNLASDSALLRESEDIVAQYAHCFD